MVPFWRSSLNRECTQPWQSFPFEFYSPKKLTKSFFKAVHHFTIKNPWKVYFLEFAINVDIIDLSQVRAFFRFWSQIFEATALAYSWPPNMGAREILYT